jgi:hypothetical protein
LCGWVAKIFSFVKTTTEIITFNGSVYYTALLIYDKSYSFYDRLVALKRAIYELYGKVDGYQVVVPWNHSAVYAWVASHCGYAAFGSTAEGFHGGSHPSA